MKKTKIILSYFLIFIFTIQFCLALGVRPAKTIMLSEETDKLDGTFWIVNNDHMAFSAKVYTEGEMAQFIELKTKDKDLVFREDTDALPVEFKIELKKDQVPPGESAANIIVEQMLDSASANTISAKIVLKHKIIIQGPFPDKYISAKLNFFESGDNIRMVSEVKNLGKLDIAQLQTKFYVNDKEQKEHVLETEKTSLKTDENKLLDANIERDLFQTGEFQVSAVTTYDDQKVEVIKNLVLGQPGVDITYFDKFFVANKINQYSMELLNLWNNEIRNVFVDVDIKKDQEKIDNFRTKSIDLQSLASGQIKDYLDEKSPGEYSFEMAVNFWNNYKMDKETFEVEFITEDEYQKLPSPTGAATSSLGGVSLMVIIILASLTTGVIVFFLVKRSLLKRNQEPRSKKKGI